MNKDCFAFVEKNNHEGCKALKELYCKNDKCRFYKRKCEVSLGEIEKSIKKYAQKQEGTYDKK